MPKQNAQNYKPNLWDYVSLASAAIFVIFLIFNIYNRLLIIDILSKKSVGSVGSDAPLQYPLVLGFIAAGISLYVSKQKTSKLWAIATTVLLIGLLIWFFGLKHAVKNSFQM